MSAKEEVGKTMRIDIHPDFKEDEFKKYSLTEDDVSLDTLDDVSPDFEGLFQAIYDAVVLSDLKGNILRYNARAAYFFRMSDSAFYSTNIVNLISGAEYSLIDAILKNLSDQRYTLIEARCVRSDSSSFPCEIAVNKLDVKDKTCLCFFIRDVTVRKKAQEALEDAVARLEAHDRARSQFVSNVSHELRTPLTSMIYAVNNMLKGVVGDIPEAARRYLVMLDGDCKRLLGTINDILDLRKIETQTLTLTKATVPFARLVRRTTDSLRVQAQQKNINVTFNEPDKMWFVKCDINKIERVVLNIIINALKFTPEGGNIDIEISKAPNDDNSVLLKISDSGIGIPQEDIPNVTKRYYTVGEQPSGSGLGLAISKEIVEMHHGKLIIESPCKKFNCGTAVSITLPTEEPPKVLIVEDNIDVRKVLESQIASQGYRIETASDGKEALACIEREKPDLILLDLVMPEMDGSEVILKLKSNKETMRIPIIVVTGANVDKSKAQVLNSFAIPALSKPWKEVDLLDKIEGSFLGVATLYAGKKIKL